MDMVTSFEFFFILPNKGVGRRIERGFYGFSVLNFLQFVLIRVLFKKNHMHILIKINYTILHRFGKYFKRN